MAASNFEFKYRFWIFGALFWIAFAAYNVDHQNAAAALVNWIAHLRGATASDAEVQVVFAVAALICLAAALLRTWATAYLNAEVMVDMQMHTSRLVADGPYRYVRNPLYLGNILLGIGFGLIASRIGFVILVAGMILFDYRLILRRRSWDRGDPGRQLSRLLRRRAATAAGAEPEVAVCRTRAQLGGRLPGRSLYVGIGCFGGGPCHHLEADCIFRRARIRFCGLCNLSGYYQDATQAGFGGWSAIERGASVERWGMRTSREISQTRCCIRALSSRMVLRDPPCSQTPLHRRFSATPAQTPGCANELLTAPCVRDRGRGRAGKGQCLFRIA